MAISQSRYVVITSGVGGASAASRKNMGTRCFTTNPLAPTNQVLEFSGSAADVLSSVGNYFGTQSAEYDFASKECTFVSKSIRMINMISFARYTPSAVAPTLTPTQDATSLSAFQAITAGGMTISLGGTKYTLSDVNLSSAESLSAVATAIQSAIQANVDGGSMYTAATVTYENNVFVLTGGETGAATIDYATGDGGENDLSVALMWNQASAPILSNGAAAETVSEALDRVKNLSNNFASFVFLPALSAVSDMESASSWATAQNMQFIYSLPVTQSNYSEVSTALNGSTTTVLTYDAFNDYAEYMPCVLGATTNYNAPNGTINPMFQVFPNDEPSVTTDALANTLDPLFINYYGQTQQAGKGISFYQRGYTMDGTDIAVVFNEIWLKDAIAVQAFNMLLGLNKIPANNDGISLLTTAFSSIFAEALTNGVFQAGKELTSTQQAYIDQLTGETDSWRNVYNNGFIFIPAIEQQTLYNATNYVFVYSLIYSKGDSIRKIEGTHVLI